jgi:hypothetical protein
MLVEIRKPKSGFKDRKWDFVLTILETPFGLVCFLIYLLLLGDESYYRTRISTEPNTIFIGGFCSFIGLFLLVGMMRAVYKHRKRYTGHMAPNSEYYIVLDDNGYERGVKGFWSESRSWKMVSGYKEHTKSFTLRSGLNPLVISKNDFKKPEDVDALREFLKKQFSVPAQTATV